MASALAAADDSNADALQLVPAGDRESDRAAAQDAASALAKLDVLVEAAIDCQQPRLLGLAQRARQQAHKDVVGAAKDDPAVVRAVLDAEDVLTRQRERKRAALAAKKRKAQ